MYQVNEFYRIIISEPIYPIRKRVVYKSDKFPFKPSVDKIEKIINELDYKFINHEQLIIKVKKEYEITKE